MLVVKGLDVSFEMSKGGEIVLPRDHGMMHDKRGSLWPRCSLLFGPFEESEEEETELDEDAAGWFGDEYEAMRGEVDRPPKDLASAWHPLGKVRRIVYYRTGVLHPDLFEHEFGRRRVQAFFKKGELPMLYELGAFCRLELGSSCVVDERGIVFP
jgi:hypothetical protein